MEGREPRFKNRISKRRENITGGLILLGIGGVLLARQVGADLPSWLFTWPMILIIVGLFVGAKTQFRDFGWLILIGIGVFFLLDKMQDIPIREFILPIGIITVGLIILSSGLFKKSRNKEDGDTTLIADQDRVQINSDATSDDIMEVVSVFGSAKRVVFSKNFKGGEVVSIFGSSEINLTNADFNGRLVLEIVQIFGGTKLIIPPHWEVHSKTAAVFGGIEDKRSIQQGTTNPEKVLVLDGVTIFGGVTIASY
ncbi:MAG: LiaF transmembrane domain-containing protein [Flavitalea sp.]